MDKISVIGAIADGLDREKKTLDAYIRVLVDSENANSEELPRKLKKHAMNKSQILKWVELNTTKPEYKKMSKVKLAKAIEDLEQNFGLGDAVKFSVNSNNGPHYYLSRQIEIMSHYFGIKKHAEQFKPILVSIQSLKGGTGKTTTATTLATKLACDLQRNIKVLLVDFDPQGSAGASLISKYSKDSTALTMTDLVLSHFEKGAANEYLQNMTMTELVQRCPFKTHLSNLDVIPAHPNDTRLNAKFWQAGSDNQIAIINIFEKEIIPALKEKYDVILIDTPPQDEAIGLTVTNASEFMLVPFTPNELDLTALANFFKSLKLRFTQVPSGGKNIKEVKVLTVNFNSSDSSQMHVRNKMQRAVPRGSFYTSFVEKSNLFNAAAISNRTIYDCIISENLTSDMDFEKAVKSFNGVYDSIVSDIEYFTMKGV
ncbi:MAG: ParA family protein [Bacteroidetes bacterium]|nr:ParA family protein [Bacteroidota bacterium]